MTRILTCFHISADLDMLSESEWISGSESGYIDTCYLKKSINCYDESALELTCRFADRCGTAGTDCFCTAVTASPKSGERFLETLAAVGFTQTDRIHLMDDAGETVLSSERTAALLYSYIRKQEPFDLILTGMQSADGNQGKVPLLLAELLNIRCISQVIDFYPVDDRHAAVSYYKDDALCGETISYPALLAVGNAADTYLRVPTLKQRMKSKKQPIAVFDPEVLRKDFSGICGAEAVFESMAPDIQKREPVLIDGGDALENAGTMYHYYRKWMDL